MKKKKKETNHQKARRKCTQQAKQYFQQTAQKTCITIPHPQELGMLIWWMSDLELVLLRRHHYEGQIPKGVNNGIANNSELTGSLFFNLWMFE